MCMSLTIRYTWGAPKISGLMFWAERHGQRCSKNNYLDTCFVAFVNLVCQHCAQIGHGLLIKSKKIWIAAISMWKLSQPRGVLKIRGKSSPFSPAKCTWNSPKDINLASDELKKRSKFGRKTRAFRSFVSGKLLQNLGQQNQIWISSILTIFLWDGDKSQHSNLKSS